jgi:spermidine synthase
VGLGYDFSIKMRVEFTLQEIESAGYFEERAPLQQTSTRYEVERCLFSDQTGNAWTVIIENPDYGRMLFLDNELQSSAFDEAIYHETLVHPVMRAMSGHIDKRVLVVGAAEGATVREVMRWGVNQVRNIDWVDIDGPLVDVCREYLQYAPNVYNTSRVNYYAADIGSFLQDPAHSDYDVIILDLPDPDPREHYLYGVNFWNQIRNAMSQRGAVVTHVGPVEPRTFDGLDIVRRGANMGGGTPYHTLIPSFQGEWGFWMSCASNDVVDMPLDTQVMNNAYHRTIMHWDTHWGM